MSAPTKCRHWLGLWFGPALFACGFSVLAQSGVTQIQVDAQLDPEHWPAQPTAPALLALNPVRQVLLHFESTPTCRISIRYGAGDGGKYWARDLRNWLVSFGVPLSDIKVEPAAGSLKGLQLVLEKSNPSTTD
jgi:hypothetical protein